MLVSTDEILEVFAEADCLRHAGGDYVEPEAQEWLDAYRRRHRAKRERRRYMSERAARRIRERLARGEMPYRWGPRWIAVAEAMGFRFVQREGRGVSYDVYLPDGSRLDASCVGPVCLAQGVTLPLLGGEWTEARAVERPRVELPRRGRGVVSSGQCELWPGDGRRSA